MKTISLNITVLIAATLLLSSCLDLDTPPYDRDSDLTFWNDPLSATQTLNSCYESLSSSDEVIYSDATTDNAYCDDEHKVRDIGNGAYSPAYGYVQSIWNFHYHGIKKSNRLIENIGRVPDLSAELRNRYVGEAKVLRAWHYFELYSRFGDVPYYTHMITMSESATIGRTPKAEVVSKTLIDLDEVINNDYLPTSYPAADKGRITIWAAKALKARILLFESRWAELKTITEDIMANSGHALFTGGYEQLFTAANEGNTEVILDVQYEKTYRPNNGTQYQFLPPSLGGYAALAPLQELVDSYVMTNGIAITDGASGYDPLNPYRDRDPRLAATIVYNGNSYPMKNGTHAVINTTPGASLDGYGFASNCSRTGYYLKKYWDNDYRSGDVRSSGLNTILIRYADVLLMNAEAYAETNGLTQAVWDNTIKPIRDRAGFTAIGSAFPTGKSGAELIEIVRNERRCELAFEGARLRDIYRWKIAENVLNGWCHGIYTGLATGTDNGFVRVEQRQFQANKHYLWAIPQADRDINRNLVQNANW